MLEVVRLVPAASGVREAVRGPGLGRPEGDLARVLAGAGAGVDGLVRVELGPGRGVGDDVALAGGAVVLGPLDDRLVREDGGALRGPDDLAGAMGAALRETPEVATDIRASVLLLTPFRLPSFLAWTTRSPPRTGRPSYVRSYRVWTVPSTSLMTSRTTSASLAPSPIWRAAAGAAAWASWMAAGALGHTEHAGARARLAVGGPGTGAGLDADDDHGGGGGKSGGTQGSSHLRGSPSLDPLRGGGARWGVVRVGGARAGAWGASAGSATAWGTACGATA